MCNVLKKPRKKFVNIFFYSAGGGGEERTARLLPRAHPRRGSSKTAKIRGSRDSLQTANTRDRFTSCISAKFSFSIWTFSFQCSSTDWVHFPSSSPLNRPLEAREEKRREESADRSVVDSGKIEHWRIPAFEGQTKSFRGPCPILRFFRNGQMYTHSG